MDSQGLSQTRKYPYSRVILDFAIAVAAFLAGGCSKVPSDNVKTAGIYASYSIKGNNQNSVVCTVQFQAGGSTGTFLDLSSGDSATCNGQSMSRNEFAGIITYSATLSYAVGVVYTVVFSRANEGSYTSTVTLPEAIEGMSPGHGTTIQKGSALTASWVPSTNLNDKLNATLDIRLNSSRSITHAVVDSSPENGSLGFSGDQTQVTPPEVGNWAGVLTLKRYRMGAMAEGLKGMIQASQQSTVNLTLVDRAGAL